MTNIFDNVSSVTHNNKRVASIISDGGVIYEVSYLDFTFTGTTLTQDSDGSFSGTDMVIDYGDGTIETTTGKFGHTYLQNGTYTVKIYNVTSLGNYCFWYCTGLTSINIPDSVTSLGKDCFYNCTGLTSINIPNSVTSLGHFCFENCTGLTSINIPNSVTSIGTSCFQNCTGLTSIILNWTTSSQIIAYLSTNNWIKNTNANLKFKIPTGTKSLYIAKGYPSDKLDDGTAISSVNLSATKTTLSKSHNDTATLTATVLDSNNQSVSGAIVEVYNGNSLIGTMTENNGVYTYTYTSQGIGDVSFYAKCNDISSETCTIKDAIYALIPQIDTTKPSNTYFTILNNDVISNLPTTYKIEFDMKSSTAPTSGMEERLYFCPTSVWTGTAQPSEAVLVDFIYPMNIQAGVRRSSQSSGGGNTSTSTNTWVHMRIEKVNNDSAFYFYLNDTYLTWWTLPNAKNYNEWFFAFALWSPTTFSIKNLIIEPL